MGTWSREQFAFGGLEIRYDVPKREGQEMSQRKMTFDLGLGGRFASLVIRGNVKPSSHAF